MERWGGISDLQDPSFIFDSRQPAANTRLYHNNRIITFLLRRPFLACGLCSVQKRRFHWLISSKHSLRCATTPANGTLSFLFSFIFRRFAIPLSLSRYALSQIKRRNSKFLITSHIIGLWSKKNARRKKKNRKRRMSNHHSPRQAISNATIFLLFFFSYKKTQSSQQSLAGNFIRLKWMGKWKHCTFSSMEFALLLFVRREVSLLIFFSHSDDDDDDFFFFFFYFCLIDDLKRNQNKNTLTDNNRMEYIGFQ